MSLAEPIITPLDRESPIAGPSSLLAKRAFDVVVGIPLCLVAVPLIAVFAVALVVQHRCSPFFVQRRVGVGGALVAVPKLRTLPVDVPKEADKTVVALQPASPLASFLRRSHLDELPQLLVVPLGHLSLVGPRPRMLSEAKACGDAHFNAVRTIVPQGCTGLWQISLRTDGRVSDAPEFDEFYVRHRSVRLDAWILWRTFAQLLGRGGVGLDDVPRWAVSSPAVASWPPR